METSETPTPTVKRYGLNMRVDKATRDQLKELAAAFGVPKSDVVRILIGTAHAKYTRTLDA